MRARSFESLEPIFAANSDVLHYIEACECGSQGRKRTFAWFTCSRGHQNDKKSVSHYVNNGRRCKVCHDHTFESLQPIFTANGDSLQHVRMMPMGNQGLTINYVWYKCSQGHQNDKVTINNYMRGVYRCKICSDIANGLRQTLTLEELQPTFARNGDVLQRIELVPVGRLGKVATFVWYKCFKGHQNDKVRASSYTNQGNRCKKCADARKQGFKNRKINERHLKEQLLKPGQLYQVPLFALDDPTLKLRKFGVDGAIKKQRVQNHKHNTTKVGQHFEDEEYFTEQRYNQAFCELWEMYIKQEVIGANLKKSNCPLRTGFTEVFEPTLENMKAIDRAFGYAFAEFYYRGLPITAP